MIYYHLRNWLHFWLVKIPICLCHERRKWLKMGNWPIFLSPIFGGSECCQGTSSLYLFSVATWPTGLADHLSIQLSWTRSLIGWALSNYTRIIRLSHGFGDNHIDSSYHKIVTICYYWNKAIRSAFQRLRVAQQCNSQSLLVTSWCAAGHLNHWLII